MKVNTMDRGTGAMKNHLSDCESLSMRQARFNWWKECLGFERKTEFKYYIEDKQVFHSLEEPENICCVLCCKCVHPYNLAVKKVDTDEEIVTVERPLRNCAFCCKCGSYQEGIISSGGNELGRIRENFWCFVPTFSVYDHNGVELYLLHQPTCVGQGLCVNCCAEGNPFTRGCFKESIRIYAPNEDGTTRTNKSEDPYLGVILKKPRDYETELFSDAVTMDLEFPKYANPDEKGLLTGIAVFINSIFYEN